MSFATLKLTSCLSEIADSTCQAVADYITARLSIPVEFINNIPWQQRVQLLVEGEIQLGWLCGLLYAWKKDRAGAPFTLLATPVMAGERYQNRPIYFSDVVVHRHSPFQTFADLRGASWAYNEPGSYSGYHLVRSHLARLGEKGGYFGRVVESGAHLASLQMICQRQVDAAAIDSTVLDLVSRGRPALRSQIRVIETLGPSPAPPWVMVETMPQEIRTKLSRLLQQMHHHPSGRRVLRKYHLARFAAAQDRDYDSIRSVAAIAEQATL